MCLIGESLMRSPNPGLAIKSLRLDPTVPVEADTMATSGAYTAGLEVVKVCGVTNPDDAIAACRSGANLIGVIFADSARKVDAEQAAAVSEAVRAFGERGKESRPKIDKSLSLRDKAAAFRDSCTRPQVVGVFQNTPADEINAIVEQAGLDFVQLHGSEGFAACADISVPVIRVVDIEAEDARPGEEIGASIVEKLTNDPAVVLLDTAVRGVAGGAGVTFNWDVARHLQDSGYPVIVAGGLTADTVSDVVSGVRPFGVDVCSGVEGSVKGVKDVGKVEAFVGTAREVGERSKDGI
jgi:anthranilate synthase/indole-3-glycerol phosphate synthase/phosphoribosylanthranilate isomerase